MSYLSIYMTAASEDEAHRIARVLVEERLVACVNCLPKVTSFYRWEGAVETANEVVLIAKTEASRFDAVCARVKALHSYEVPCVVGVPVERGLDAYLGWVSDSLEG